MASYIANCITSLLLLFIERVKDDDVGLGEARISKVFNSEATVFAPSLPSNAPPAICSATAPGLIQRTFSFAFFPRTLYTITLSFPLPHRTSTTFISLDAVAVHPKLFVTVTE